MTLDELTEKCRPKYKLELDEKPDIKTHELILHLAIETNLTSEELLNLVLENPDLDLLHVEVPNNFLVCTCGRTVIEFALFAQVVSALHLKRTRSLNANLTTPRYRNVTSMS